MRSFLTDVLVVPLAYGIANLSFSGAGDTLRKYDENGLQQVLALLILYISLEEWLCTCFVIFSP